MRSRIAVGTSVTTHRLERNGATLFYDIVGDGRPMVVVPGGPGFGSAYLRDTLGLGADDRRLIFVDQRGSGRSTGCEHPGLLTMSVFVDDLDAVRAELGHDRIDLVGHSFGGLQSLYYALLHENRVRSLILIESDPPTFQEWIRFHEVLATRSSDERDQLLATIESRSDWQNDPDALEAYFRAHLQPYFGCREHASSVRFGFEAGSLEKMTIVARAVRGDLGEWDITAALGRLTTPALIVYGTRSIFPSSAVLSMKQSLPHGRLEMMEGVGHFPFVENPTAFSRILQDFLATL